MLTIGKNTWHYRLYSRYGDGQPYVVNLCPYMRRVGVGIIMVLFITSLLTMVSILILEPIAILILWNITGSFYLNFFGPDNSGVLIGIDITLIIIVLGYFMVVGCKQISYRIRNSFEEKIVETPDGFLRIFSTWMKAIHEKICPKIEVK